MNWLIWSPLIVLGTLLVVLLVFVVLGRVAGGRYLRPIVELLSKVPFIRRSFEKASLSALERKNPDLASAVRKIQTVGTPKTPEQAQRALALLNPAERKAYLDAAGEQQSEVLEPSNRQQRRMMERGVKPGQPVQQIRPMRGKKRPR